jgi:uncharacterized protein (TIGR00251 family)
MRDARAKLRESLEFFSVRGADLLLRLRIQPRASRDGIDEVRAGRLHVRICSPPVQGAANDSLIKLIAHASGVPRSTVRLMRGEKSRDKEIILAGAAAACEEIIARLTLITK